MAITKMDSGKYKVEVFYPKVVREILGTTVQRFRKTYPTKVEAQKAEKDIKKKIKRVKEERHGRMLEQKGDIKFEDFYEQVWLDMYRNGSSGKTRQIPSPQTVKRTEDIFRLHLLPLFGEYSLSELNTNNSFVLQQLNAKSQTYANIKIIKSYINQLFDIAELLEYIEYNRIARIIRYVGDPLKQRLKQERALKGESLSAEELIAWIKAVQDDYETGDLSFQDYVLFTLTLNLGSRKSESYALQWKHIDLDKGTILLVQNITRDGTLTSTKGRKNTQFQLPLPLLNLLSKWKEVQAVELNSIGFEQTKEQFLFTDINQQGKMNQPVHIDYLNHRIKSVRNRHKHLAHASPHKLRHTFSTLAYEGGASMEEISRALTHSDVKTTQCYVNTPNVVDLSTYQKFEQRLKSIQIE